MKRFVVFLFVFAFTFNAVADEPAETINTQRHPHLSEAQHHIVLAYKKLKDAERTNRYGVGENMHKAAELLEQANDEIRAAAERVNERKKH